MLLERRPAKLGRINVQIAALGFIYQSGMWVLIRGALCAAKHWYPEVQRATLVQVVIMDFLQENQLNLALVVQMVNTLKEGRPSIANRTVRFHVLLARLGNIQKEATKINATNARKDSTKKKPLLFNAMHVMLVLFLTSVLLTIERHVNRVVLDGIQPCWVPLLRVNIVQIAHPGGMEHATLLGMSVNVNLVHEGKSLLLFLDLFLVFFLVFCVVTNKSLFVLARGPATVKELHRAMNAKRANL